MPNAAASGRWTVAAAVLASGAVFLESTVVTVALPALGRDLGLSLAGLQWVLNGYLLTLSALMLLGGSLGDLYGHRRVLLAGLAAFSAACVGAALAPSAALLVVARLAQGAAGAILVPNTLALLNAAFDGDARGTAIARWAAWSSVSTALGPLVGGWLVDALSWRWVFAVPVPFGLAALVVAWRAVPNAQAPNAKAPNAKAPNDSPRRVDALGALLATLGLAALTWALVAAPARGIGDARVLAAAAGGLGALAAFLVRERRVESPMLPLDLFRSRQFAGANLVTLFVYAALGGLFFVLTLRLQNDLHYSALAAGSALLPVNAIMLTGSTAAGRLARRVGARLPLVAGSLVAGAGMALLARVAPGRSYVGAVLPGVLVFGAGLALLVAPLTAAVLGAVEAAHGGVASAVNNAAARLAGLLAAAALPLAAGLRSGAASGGSLDSGYARAMWICAALCAVGALVAAGTIAGGAPRDATPRP